MGCAGYGFPVNLKRMRGRSFFGAGGRLRYFFTRRGGVGGRFSAMPGRNPSEKTLRIRPGRYSARDGAVVGRNLERFFNRPLYIANAPVFALAGDRPVIRFAGGDTLLGTLWFGVIRGRRAAWLHAFDDLTMEYRAANVRWVARDRKFTGLVVTADVVAFGEAIGFAARVTVTGARRGDRLVWAFGGAKAWPDKNLSWELDPHRTPPHAPEWFDAKFCAGNAAQAAGQDFSVAVAAPAKWLTKGRCDAPGGIRLVDAAAVGNPATLLDSIPSDAPLVAGEVDLAAAPIMHWELLRSPRARGHRAKKTAHSVRTPAEAFAVAMARSSALSKRVLVDTPDERLNALGAVLSAAKDGSWYPPRFHHGAMLWNVPYVGWRTTCGATVLGWHERVKAQAIFYLGHQEKSSKNRTTAMDPKTMLTVPARDSRFYGRGRIQEDQGLYNMQSQLFDQLIHAWEWTGDPELEALLRPALELHLEWLRECFDPDDDALYESVINVWPTDSVWFAGGAATEETSYAYRGHVAASKLAERAGDAKSARRHAQRASRIRAAFRRKLWVASEGHAGLYREQEGRRRLHNDPWLYSIFLPVDAGLVGPAEARQSLLYAERSLQNDRMPCGGRQVWTSNFVPAIWSVRERWPGDNHHLALAYFQAGLGEDGWDIFRGTFLHTAFDQAVPGDLGAPAGGTDFGDSTDMAARALVEGLFGYAPKRSVGLVRITPQFPSEWKHARLRTPDVHLSYARSAHATTLEVELTNPARLEIRLPISARNVASVTANGRKVRWTAEAGPGRSFVKIQLPATLGARIEVKADASTPIFPPVVVSGSVAGRVRLRSNAGRIISFSDPQGSLVEASIRDGVIVARLGAKAGWHTVLAKVLFGNLPQLTRFHLRIADPVAVRAAAAQRPEPSARGDWLPVDLGPALNGDIRAIYTQQYLSPRPATMSARIGTDGYTPWTFIYWNSFPPVIKLDRVPELLEKPGGARLLTPQGVPFAWPGETRNVAFTSHWDNWPDRVTVPIGRAAASVWFLVAGSTNPMQGRIANAVLRMRYAGAPDEVLELVPPLNYWNLSPIRPVITAPGQDSRFDYTADADAYCVPKPWPQTVQLGENCRAMLLSWRLRPGKILQSVTLETLSAEVVVGLMGVTLMNPK
ncbi:MAG: hypothetical protein JWM32_2944 [Verrucomicrobia bacterium]|nr:hypothetical protein [Verrucomicrobiota bacterium]